MGFLAETWQTESLETVSIVIMGDSVDTKSSEMVALRNTESSETEPTAATEATGSTESSEKEAATVSAETGKVCTAQMHKMAIAITRNMENKTSTSETHGAAAPELESAATGRLESAEAGGIECVAAGGLESVVGGEGLGMMAACAVVSGGYATQDASLIRPEMGPVGEMVQAVNMRDGPSFT